MNDNLPKGNVLIAIPDKGYSRCIKLLKKYNITNVLYIQRQRVNYLWIYTLDNTKLRSVHIDKTHYDKLSFSKYSSINITEDTISNILFEVLL